MDETTADGDLLRDLEPLEPGARLDAFLQRLEDVDEVERLGLLNNMLCSPDRWRRELAAEASNRLGVDPLAAEPGPTEVSEPVLELGFEESSPDLGPATEPVGVDSPESLIRIEDSMEEPVVFLPGASSGAARPAPGGAPARARVPPVASLLVGALTVLMLGAYLVGTAPSTEDEARQAEMCRAKRLLLEEAVARYRSSSSLEGRFLENSRFQHALIREGLLDELVTCPEDSRWRGFSVEDGNRVRCRNHGS